MTDSTVMLSENAKLRTARKHYRCIAADEVRGWSVETTTTNGGTGERRHYGWTQEAAEDEAAALVGTASNFNSNTGRVVATYATAKAVPIINPEYRGKSAECREDIEPGDQYVEYVGESGPYESGSRYCSACGLKTWAANA